MLKILLVDDEVQEREGIRFLIDKYGFPLEIAEAQNGKVAFEYIKTHEVDILFTDVKMPYMDGLELAKAVNEYDKKIVIIIFSAYSEFEYAKKACAANAVNYLLKPIEVEEFESVMKKVITHCEELRHWEEQKNFLQQADKKLLLYKLMNNKDSMEEISQRLKGYEISLDNKYMQLISVETVSNYFEKNEGEFAQILRKNMTISYEYINLYPNHTYVLLFSSMKVEEPTVERAVKKIYMDMTECGKKMVSIIVGERFHGIEKLSEKIQAIEALREDTFSYFSGIIYASSIHEKDINKIEEAVQIKDSIFRSIEDKNLSAVREQMNRYLDKLGAEKTSSAFYTKYILLDIVKALYDQYGIYNQSQIFQTTDEIMKCDYLDEIKGVVERIMEEIEKLKKNKIPDGSSTVHELQKIINNEYMKDLSLDELAERVYLTPAYVSYIFKQETGYNLI
ncbi:MAG: response regulator, partial [Acetivibrio sp.]